ncbi:unnamed protein product [Ranitomeya imitator]|uniref:Uncharacterized protein n=1 Tax=Ranitomeya imitator TaxID=111125 RepID=A0ABN9MN13_9NEOB|nr:unnamed protein product [Ranitomeya imitator]
MRSSPTEARADPHPASDGRPPRWASARVAAVGGASTPPPSSAFSSLFPSPYDSGGDDRRVGRQAEWVLTVWCARPNAVAFPAHPLSSEAARQGAREREGERETKRTPQSEKGGWKRERRIVHEGAKEFWRREYPVNCRAGLLLFSTAEAWLWGGDAARLVSFETAAPHRPPTALAPLPSSDSVCRPGSGGSRGRGAVVSSRGQSPRPLRARWVFSRHPPHRPPRTVQRARSPQWHCTRRSGSLLPPQGYGQEPGTRDYAGGRRRHGQANCAPRATSVSLAGSAPEPRWTPTASPPLPLHAPVRRRVMPGDARLPARTMTGISPSFGRPSCCGASFPASLPRLIKSLPFVHTAHRYYRLDGLVRSLDRPRRGRPRPMVESREDDRT